MLVRMFNKSFSTTSVIYSKLNSKCVSDAQWCISTVEWLLSLMDVLLEDIVFIKLWNVIVGDVLLCEHNIQPKAVAFSNMHYGH